jgi:hypothetical protein
MAKTVAEEIVDQLAVDYQTATGDSSTPFRFGELRRRENDRARRVVFVQTGGTIEPPARTGKSLREDFAAAALAWDDVTEVLAHIYAEDRGALQAIHHNLLVVLRRCLGTGVQFQRYTWRTEEEQGARHTNRVHVLTQPMTWRIGVPDAFQQLVTVDDLGHACEFGAGEFNNDFSRDFKFAGGEAA